MDTCKNTVAAASYVWPESTISRPSTVTDALRRCLPSGEMLTQGPDLLWLLKLCNRTGTLRSPTWPSRPALLLVQVHKNWLSASGHLIIPCYWLHNALHFLPTLIYYFLQIDDILSLKHERKNFCHIGFPLNKTYSLVRAE